MTGIFVLIMLIVIVALTSGGRFIQSYMLRAVYRRLPRDYVPADRLADEILACVQRELIAGPLFRLRCRDHIPILMMLDTLQAYGFAECDARPNRKIEQTKEAMLLKTEVLEAKGLDHARASALRKLAQHLSIPEIHWRKKQLLNHEPGLLDFLPT